jgi:hypothetical protein
MSHPLFRLPETMNITTTHRRNAVMGYCLKILEIPSPNSAGPKLGQKLEEV